MYLFIAALLGSELWRLKSRKVIALNSCHFINITRHALEYNLILLVYSRTCIIEFYKLLLDKIQFLSFRLWL